MFSVLISVIGILITLVLVVGIHELGHFFMAKLAGVKVLRFSIGFGKALLTWHDKSGTEYVLSALPFGGYVKMLDEEDGEIPADELTRAYNHQPFYKKILIIAAGPFANLLFAFLLYFFLFTVGFFSVVPVIGKVLPDSIAAHAQLTPQAEITQIDSHDTPTWMSVIIYLLSRAGETTHLTMQLHDPLDHTSKTYVLPLRNWQIDDLRPDPLTSLGIVPYEPFIGTKIAKVLADTPAAKSSLQVNDEIIAVNQKPVESWRYLIKLVQQHPNEKLTLTIQRQNKILTVMVNVGEEYVNGERLGYLGISPIINLPPGYLRENKFGAGQALQHAWQDTMLFTRLNFIILGKMLTAKISLKSLGGPITIFQSAGNALNQGFVSFVSFLAFLSIAIGVINILPIPGLDGGHLLLQTIEVVRGRPLSLRVQNLVFRLGFIVLIVVMVQAVINDLTRVL